MNKASNNQAEASDQSTRSVLDAAAEMGVACTRPEERVLAAIGMLQGAPTHFEPCRDVSFGGVLCALPALIANGLFAHLQKVFPALGGYYTTLQVITLLAYMALCRIKTVEQLQYESPGELGKLMGLDRATASPKLLDFPKISAIFVGLDRSHPTKRTRKQTSRRWFPKHLQVS